MTDRIAIVVQARVGSSRLPGKVLLPLAGATLLERVVERVFAAGCASEVVVATTTALEDEPIRTLCRKRRWRCHSGHPSDLLARHVSAGRSVAADWLVKIPSDCPLIDPAVIRRVLSFALEHRDRFDFVSNLHPPSYPDGQDVEVVPMRLAEVALGEAKAAHEREHTTPFFWERPDRFRIGNVGWDRGLDASVRHRWTVDHPEDYALVRAVYETLWSEPKPTFGIEDVLGFLARHPEVDALNARHRGDTWQRRRARMVGSAA